jgi:tRNA(Ile)-lysidine synthase TilS/MesJ
MNPRHQDYGPELTAKDAIVMSGHKLLGGVGTPGVLIIKKHLVSQQNPPTRSGGGTVFYVTEDHHRFLSNRVERFEGGTPNIVGIWRLGLALTNKLQLKRQIQHLEHSVATSVLEYDILRARRIQQELAAIPNLVLMDGAFSESVRNKLPVHSFLIKCGTRFLHYNYVCAVLNDFFGIQSRGGCQCAGPFAQYLLGIHGEVNAALEECLVHTKDELLRPGFTRLSLPTFGTTKAMEDFVIRAIEWVAANGWKVLHVYRCNHRTGDWRHRSRPGAPLGKTERKWLSHYRTGLRSFESNEESTMVPSLEQAFETANSLLALVVQDQSSLMQAIKMSHEPDEDSSTLASLRWYVYPKEVASFVDQGFDEVPETMDRLALSGAVRPVAWFPRGRNAVTSSISNVECIVKPAPVQHLDTNDHRVFQFREGDHTGSASLAEIRQGYEDGELTDHCLIYHSETESWDPIAEVLKCFIASPTPEAGSLEAPAPQMIAVPIADDKQSNLWVSFRDGEHTGKATIEEIEAGFEEGELSPGCEIYNAGVDQWERIDVALGIGKSVECLDNTTSVAPLAVNKSDIPIVEKNETKKPQRDSATWGHGNMVHIKQPTITVPTEEKTPKKNKRQKHITPPPKLMRLVIQAVVQWDMIEEGDRLLFGLSGGKDSLSLLHALLELKKKLPANFEIEVCTIDPMTPSFDPSPLIPYVESLGLKYHYIRDDIVERANRAGKDGKIVSSLCSYCARMKRGNLYACARKNNCNKLVLAQHLDDLAESFMMSVMHNGFLRTMKGANLATSMSSCLMESLVTHFSIFSCDSSANYKINAGDMSVIRPLVYCRESLTADFAKKNLQGVVVNENCPACFEEPKERARIKKLLSKEEALYPNFYDNIKRSLLPLMHDDATAILRSYAEEALAKSRKDDRKKSRTDGAEEEEKKENGTEMDTESAVGGLSSWSDDQLVRELSRRRADRYRLAGAMKRVDDDEPYDPTGQVCSLNGGNGTIPCRELME